MPGSAESDISGARRTGFDEAFELVCGDATLLGGANGCIGQVLGPSHAVPCIYAWTLAMHGAGHGEQTERVVYVGKTRSLRRRVQEYLQPFQAHSPNDYKLQVFQQEALRRFPKGRFLLYRKIESVDSLTASEKRLIGLYKPLLNCRVKASDEACTEFQAAFQKFYSSGLDVFFGVTP